MATELIGYQIKVAQQTLRNTMDRMLSEISLTTPQYAVLCGVEEIPGISNADLARYCFVTPQTANEIVKSLEKKSLLRLCPHKSNKRKIAIGLTNAGIKTLKEAHKVAITVEKAMLSTLDKGEQKRFLQYLQCCIKSLET